MRKKTFIITIFTIILGILISSISFYTLISIKDLEDIEKDTILFENVILNKIDDKNELSDSIKEYAKTYNVGIEIKYKDNSSDIYNIQDKNIVYNKSFSNKNLIKDINLYYYDNDYINTYIKNTITVIAISVIIALLFINRFVIDEDKNIKKVISGMERNIIGERNKLSLKGIDKKTRILEETFNRMNEVIYENIEETKKLNIQLSSIMSSIEEGILAISSEGDIIFKNSKLKSILEIHEEIENINDIENIEIKNTLLDLAKANEKNTAYIEIKNPIFKNIKINYSDIRNYEFSKRKMGNLFMIEDITDMKKLNTIQKDFVTNISHELKTPMTSILGFVETLLEDDMDDRDLIKRFLNIINEEIIRMNKLLEDLLVLSEVELLNYEISYELIDLNELINSIFVTLKFKSNPKNIKLELNSKEDKFLIINNNNLLRQILMNLIDNSIKYNEENGYVAVTPYRKKDYLYIDILDNGIGLDEKDISRIFERFYRVDKSRSTIEGSGLGLSIVRHMVSTLNGSINIQSREGIGTLITVRLPLKTNKAVK